mgnify:CR=1 FL=1
MNLEIQSLRRAEAATLRLRGLYESYGYRKYRMGRFEEYSLYAANKSFLLGENVPQGKVFRLCAANWPNSRRVCYNKP